MDEEFLQSLIKGPENKESTENAENTEDTQSSATTYRASLILAFLCIAGVLGGIMYVASMQQTGKSTDTFPESSNQINTFKTDVLGKTTIDKNGPPPPSAVPSGLTASPTQKPTPTSIPTPTSAPTSTPAPTQSATPTPAPTNAPTATPTPTPTLEPTATPTPQ